MSTALEAAATATAIGCALNSGFFFAFSVVVMPSLARIAPAEGIRTMRKINLVVLNPLFFALFAGTAILCLVTAALSLADWSSSYGPQLLIAAALHLGSVIGITMSRSQPLNLELGGLDAEAPDAAEAWRRYLDEWVPLNHVRVLAPLAASVLLLTAIL